MKRIILTTLLFTFIGLNSNAQETVYSVVQEVKPNEWYYEQARLWKAEIDKNNQNAEAWYNYYSAHRALMNRETTEEKRLENRKIGKQIIKDVLAAIPNSFEANHLAYWDIGIGNGGEKYLEKANQIDPNDPRIFDDIMILHAVEQNDEGFKKVTRKIYETEQLPPGLLNWGYNVLSEVDENAIVFVAGDNDTYALWVVQGALGYREDVTVINTSLMLLDDHRERLENKLGMDHFGKIKHQPFHDLYLHFLDNGKNIPAYVAMTAYGQFDVDSISENLYLNGLTYKFCKNDFDNLSVIRRNYEKRYKLDYLDVEFTHHQFYEHLESLKAMYLASMIKLYSHYKVSEQLESAKKLEALIKKISEQTGKTGEVEELLKDC